jgi:hypothetical protein
MLDRVQLIEEERKVEASLEKKAPSWSLIWGFSEKLFCKSYPNVIKTNGTSLKHFFATAV